MVVRDVFRSAVPLLVLALAAGPVWGAGPRGPGNQIPLRPPIGTAGGTGLTIVRTLNAVALAECLLGPDFTVTGATITGAAAAIGAFYNGTDVLDLPAGVVLGTGDIDVIARPNQGADTSTDHQTPGYPPLGAILNPEGTPTDTYDAVVLTIDFTTATPTTLTFSSVFGSEEYNEFVDDAYNDVFAILLDGTVPIQNMGLTRGPCVTTQNLVIAVNNINCGPDGTNTTATNCACFRDNTAFAFETELDGLTRVLVNSAPLTAGAHTVRLAIADAVDSEYDSAAFIRCPSGEVPARTSTWGRVKTIYR